MAKGAQSSFIARLKIKRRQSFISQLKDDDGEWVFDSQELKNMAISVPKGAVPPVDTSQWQFPSLNHFYRSWLNRDVTDRIGPNKASRPDGFPLSVFFKNIGHQWETLL